ncbi:MAG: MBL fold metallo-hydrolase [Proteobacteria bacterium]|nr:MBL fold metallo-hydrolase [Pseudomonadota bacterium]
MELTWWGTAGFRVRSGDDVFLIDPYLTRNAAARPAQPLGPSDVSDGTRIFLSHGHFDHIQDVPAIAARTGAEVYCCPAAGGTLVGNGLGTEQVRAVTEDGRLFDFETYQAQAFYSRHVVFDRPLIFRTLLRANIRFFSLMPLMKKYPLGQVLSWRFTVEGKTVHHFGSGGSLPEELDRLGRQPTDILLVPLQGHTKICDIALNYVRALKPGLVIPHHQDDFFPPVSQMVDIEPFLQGVRRECPGTGVRVMKMNETVTL